MYSVNQKIGPKMSMIANMLWGLVIFLFILLVFLIPYGVASQAMLYPNTDDFNLEMLKNIIYYPYYRIYGELFLEESEGQRDGCNSSIPGDGINCPVYNVMPPFLLAVYMVVVFFLDINRQI